MTEDEINELTSDKLDKKMVILAMIFIFVVTMTALVMMFAASFHLSGVAFWVLKSVFGTIAMTGLGGLVGITRTFFDTRSAEIKAKDKRVAKQDKYAYKLSRIKLQKGVHNG